MNNLLGTQATLLHQIRVEDLASNWQNEIDVLATPILLWLAELACMDALKNELADDEMTVGTGHTMQHLAPTPLGDTIRLTATVIEVVEKKLVFAIEGYDCQERIISGRHE